MTGTSPSRPYFMTTPTAWERTGKHRKYVSSNTFLSILCECHFTWCMASITQWSHTLAVPSVWQVQSGPRTCLTFHLWRSHCTWDGRGEWGKGGSKEGGHAYCGCRVVMQRCGDLTHTDAYYLTPCGRRLVSGLVHVVVTCHSPLPPPLPQRNMDEVKYFCKFL